VDCAAEGGETRREEAAGRLPCNDEQRGIRPFCRASRRQSLPK